MQGGELVAKRGRLSRPGTRGWGGLGAAERREPSMMPRHRRPADDGSSTGGVGTLPLRCGGGAGRIISGRVGIASPDKEGARVPCHLQRPATLAPPSLSVAPFTQRAGTLSPALRPPGARARQRRPGSASGCRLQRCEGRATVCHAPVRVASLIYKGEFHNAPEAYRTVVDR